MEASSSTIPTKMSVEIKPETGETVAQLSVAVKSAASYGGTAWVIPFWRHHAA